MDEPRLSDVLSEFARTLLTDFPIERILDHLVERIVTVLPISAAGVTLISPTTDPQYVAASDESALRFEQLQTELGEGPCLAAYQSRSAVSVPDLDHDDRFPTFAARALDAGLVAVFTFPLLIEDQCLGALDLYRTEPGALDDSAMTAAQTLADVTTAYLLNAQARTDLEVASQQAYETSLHDDLTGLANRVLLVQRLSHAIDKGSRTGRPAAVLFCDVDRFKQVNDTFGHHVGDQLLVALADRLNGLVRPGDTLVRMAGDEFAVLCEDLEDVGQAHGVAERIKVALAQPLTLPAGEILVTVSVGIAFSTPAKRPQRRVPLAVGGHMRPKVPNQRRSSPDETVGEAEALLREADVAMYQVKRMGGGHHRAASVRDLQLTNSRLNLMHDLGGALERGELQTEYQPIVSMQRSDVTGAEALLRWRHPTLGLIGPSVFIPLAERAGVMVDLGLAVLRRACEDRASWPENCPAGRPVAPLGVAVNVSVHQLMSAGFAASVEEVLEETGTPPALVTLEVTESALIEDHPRALVVLSSLRRLGVRLALDDFGTGSSSLTHLRDFPVDVVKIDRSFVADLGAGSTSRHIVEAVVTLADRLGMQTIAEGVETSEQWSTMRELGCDAYQGFIFSPSVASEALPALL